MPEPYPPATAPAAEPAAATKRRRKWTADDQSRAEVAAACGAGYTAIALALGWSDSVIRRHLVPAVAEADREHNRQRYYANPESERERRRRRYQADHGAEHERPRRRREKDPEAERERASASMRLYYQQHPEARREKDRRYYQRHPEVFRERNRRRKAIKRAARQGSLTPLTLAAKNAAFARFGNRCAYCGKGGKMTVDHVDALISGGLDEIGNILPACMRCNCSKNKSPTDSWYRSQPFFCEKRWRKILKYCGPAAGGQMSLSLT